MRRSAFLAAACAAAGSLDVVQPARATGGLDIGDASLSHDVRILLATDAFEPPRQLDEWHFAWNGGTYRGRAVTQILDGGRSALIDVLPLDAYLYGVLGKEVSPAWPAQAQAAQAIVARTFALGRLRPKKPYDVVASVSDQRYDGIASETPQGREAVDATSGQVVTFAGMPADVAYSACCGGHTADPIDVWSGARDLPYLSGVSDPNCVGTPAFRWTVDVPLAALASLGGVGDPSGIELRDLDPSGRARHIALIGRGTSLIAASEFRTALRIPSTLIASLSLDHRSGTLHVTGFGHGHGVGFCQWGSRSAAARGMTASDIVQFYFPGTDLGRA